MALRAQASAARERQGGGSGCGPPRHTHVLHVELQRHSWMGLTAGRLLSLTGKQKQTARDRVQTS